jgi:agmatinase
VAIRDFCEEEWNYSQSRKNYHLFSSAEIFRQKSEGHPWKNICRDIIHSLPDQVYVSFDIDGLEPHLCPSTGTPVPGGLEYMEAVSILNWLYQSGKQIVGFDLCEVGPQEYDGNIGARILYELCVLSVTSQAVNGGVR